MVLKRNLKGFVPSLQLVLFMLMNSLPGQSIVWSINVVDANDDYLAEVENLVVENLREAINLWDPFLEVSGDRFIELEVVLGVAIATADGVSVTSGFVGPDPDGNGNIFEAGVSHELKTGNDLNGAVADGRLRLGLNYLTNANDGALWLDPTPADRADESVPDFRSEAISIFAHEIGHVLGFYGFATADGVFLSNGDRSSFGQHVALPDVGAADQTITFAGPRAVQLYGEPIPLTSGNIFHLGNSVASGFRGSDFADGSADGPDLMNGVLFTNQRFGISGYSLAVLEDCGVPIKVTWDQFRQFPFRQSEAKQVLEMEGDIDGDGSSNFEEFALGTDPLRSASFHDTRIRVSPSSSGSAFELILPRVRALRDLRILAEESTVLDFMTPAKVTAMIPGEANTPIEMMTIGFGGLSERSRFLRLRFEALNP